MAQIDTENLEFLTDISNEVQKRISQLVDDEVQSVIDEINDKISQRSSEIASGAASSLMEDIPILEGVVSEDVIYDQLHDKVSKAIYEDLYY